ncbi:MAG: flagellar export chaperone FliS [Phycisphaerales bacterium]
MIKQEANAYLRNRVLSASQGELRLMLIDGAIKFARMGQEGIHEKNWEKVYEGVSQCQAIVLELINSLQPDAAPEICANLSGIYTFIYRRLVDACMQKDASCIEEILPLLEHDRETWVMVMSRADRERGDTTDEASRESEASEMEASATRPSLSIEG